jgi:hypothetical protein
MGQRRGMSSSVWLLKNVEVDFIFIVAKVSIYLGIQLMLKYPYKGMKIVCDKKKKQGVTPEKEFVLLYFSNNGDK